MQYRRLMIILTKQQAELVDMILTADVHIHNEGFKIISKKHCRSYSGSVLILTEHI